MSATVLTGNCLDILRMLPDQSIQCCVTSPPYYGLRDYNHEQQIGAEETPAEFIAALLTVFGEVWRVLKDDGSLWINIGDTYAAKSLIGIPWRLAFGLQDAGWIIRQDLIWDKPNAQPESVTDRCSKSHEYLFLLTKKQRYYFDADSIKEPASPVSAARRLRADSRNKDGWTEAHHGNPPRGLAAARNATPETRNKRSVWSVPTAHYPGSHFATYPPELIKPCILAGAPAGSTVLDPFCGSGTTGAVCVNTGREFIGIELNPEYAVMARQRIAAAQPPLFADLAT